jgi:hypothetical protein
MTQYDLDVSLEVCPTAPPTNKIRGRKKGGKREKKSPKEIEMRGAEVIKI